MTKDKPADSSTVDRPYARRSTYASIVVLCATILLVGGLFLLAAWLQHGSNLVPGYLPPGQTAPSQPPTIFASLIWMTLPPVGILLAIPGLRPPRIKRALIGLTGNAIAWVALPVAGFVITSFFGP